MIGRFAIRATAVCAALGLSLTPIPASASAIQAGSYYFTNYNQYLTNINGDGAPPGTTVYFTNGPGSGYDSVWQIIPHGTVSANGNTFTPGSGLNAAFDGSTIWELYEPGAALDLGTSTGNYSYAQLESPPDNFFIIKNISSDNYYIVSVYASNRAWADFQYYQTPWLLCYAGSLNAARYDGWYDMAGSRPPGSTITAHLLPAASPPPLASGQC